MDTNQQKKKQALKIIAQMNQKSGSKKGMNKITNQSGPPETVVKYMGPVVPRLFKQEADVRVVVQRLYQTISTSGGTTVAPVYGSNPSGYSNWTELSQIYDEYRVLAMEAEYQPINKYVATSTQPMYVCTDRGDTTALSSYSNALEQSSVKICNSAEKWKISIKMDGVEDAGFTPIASGVTAMVIKVYGTNFNTTQAIGAVALTVLVQYRGMR